MSEQNKVVNLVKGGITLQSKGQPSSESPSPNSTTTSVITNPISICDTFDKQTLYNYIEESVKPQKESTKTNIKLGIDNFCTNTIVEPPTSNLEVLDGTIAQTQRGTQSVIFYNSGSGNIIFEDLCLIDGSISHCA